MHRRVADGRAKGTRQSLGILDRGRPDPSSLSGTTSDRRRVGGAGTGPVGCGNSDRRPIWASDRAWDGARSCFAAKRIVHAGNPVIAYCWRRSATSCRGGLLQEYSRQAA